MTTHISESTAELKRSGSRYKVVLITPGQGSSGVYTEEMLRATGPAAFPKGTHSYLDHNPLDKRSMRDLIGVLAEDAYYEDGVGLVSALEIMPHFKDFVDSVREHAGMSIWASADIAPDGQLVEALIPDRTNSIDMVAYAGRGGELTERLLESAREAFKTSVKETASGTAPAESRNPGKKEISVEIDELATRVDKLTEGLATLTGLLTPLAESLTAAEQEKREKEAKEAAEAEITPELDFAKIAEAAIAAGLPTAAREVVYNEVRLGGASVEESIQKQKELVESIQKQVQESFGSVVRVGTDSPNQDFTVGRWNS